MNSTHGYLTGGGIRTLAPDRVDGMLRRIKVSGSGKSRRVAGVRYRISGFRDLSADSAAYGQWVRRNPRNGQYYRERDGKHRTPVRPTGDMIRLTDMIALEVEVTRTAGSTPTIYYVSIPGI
jgi:hypothetical protein